MDKENEKLFRLLEHAGWRRDVSRIISPRETISLDVEHPWEGTVQQFQAEMRRNTERIRSNQSQLELRASLNNLLLDTESLVNCIGLILRSDD